MGFYRTRQQKNAGQITEYERETGRSMCLEEPDAKKVFLHNLLKKNITTTNEACQLSMLPHLSHRIRSTKT